MKRKTLAWFGLLYLSAFVVVVLAAAANGFVTVSPDTRYGDVNGLLTENYVLAARFTITGSGTKNIKEIGLYTGSDTDVRIHMAIFSDDSANTCPDQLVENSDTGEINPENSISSKTSHTYSTYPKVTGGGTYWLVLNVYSHNLTPSRFADGAGTSIYLSGITYPNFPSGDGWHTHTDQTHSYSFYAVYEDEASTTSTTSTSTTSTTSTSTTSTTSTSTTSTTSTSTTSSTVEGATTTTLRKKQMLTMGVG